MSLLKYLPLVVGQMPDVVFMTDLEGTIRYVNAAFTKTTGYSVEDALGASTRILKSGYHDQSFYAEFWRTIVSGKNWEGRFINHKKNGEVYDCDALVMPIRSDSGELEYFLALERDVSTRLETERILERREGLLTDAERIAALGHWEWKIESDEVYWSEGLFSVLGYRVNEVEPSNENFLARISEDSRKNVQMQILSESSEGGIRSLEFDRVLPSGERKRLRASSKVETDHFQRAIRVVGALQDVSTQETAKEKARAHEEQIREAERMATLGTLTTGIAHEINNPNGLIILGASLLMDTWDDMQPILDAHYDNKGDFNLGRLPYSKMRDQLGSMIADIQDSSERIKAIVDALREYTKRGNAHAISGVNVLELIGGVNRLLTGKIMTATHRFATDIPSDLPEIKTDYHLLKQALMSIMINGCEALRNPDERLMVSAWHDQNEDRVVIEVQDEGRGISQEDLPHVTDPFFTTRRSVGGTGLGLSTAYSIIRELRGRLDIESILGQGTSIRISLPLVAPE